jgi:hypothetical protein
MFCDTIFAGAGDSDLIRIFQAKLHGSLVPAANTGKNVFHEREALISDRTSGLSSST